MSESADIVLLKDGQAEIYHHRWGATTLLHLLLSGPSGAVDESSDGAGARTTRIDDILAGAVIDLDRQTLIIAGSVDVIGSGGFTGKKLGWQEHEVLRELEPFWPGWTLGYEPDNVLAPIVHYVRGLGIPLESMNEPDALSDALGKPRWTELTYRNEARSAPAAAPGADALADDA
jgi:hypothetical protein